jgi:hypothetical protein
MTTAAYKSLDQIFAEVAPHLPPEVIFVDPRDAADLSRPNQISWRPLAAEPLKPRGTGFIGRRRWRVLVEIWGDDQAQTEQLANTFIGALHHLRSVWGFELGEEEWVVGAKTKKGVVCRMTVFVVVDIPHLSEPAVVVEAVNTTVTLETTT